MPRTELEQPGPRAQGPGPDRAGQGAERRDDPVIAIPKARGFLEHGRAKTPKRPVAERVGDDREVEGALPDAALRAQAARCMDCGVAFCHKGCPLGNQIPDWNELVRRDRWSAAADRLHATNNFPEVTGRVCPAPCEASCVLAIGGEAVSIRQVEKQVADRAIEGGLQPVLPERRTGKTVAVVGSGPAGLACAQQLARAGHAVTVYERDERPGGLLRYGIPDHKLDKQVINRRVAQMHAEGVVFRCGVEVGVDLDGADLRAEHDAVVLATGALAARDLTVPGRELPGVHLAMDYLAGHNRYVSGDRARPPIDARGKRVAILGGGDTGADCLGTALRQEAAEVHHFHYKPAPPSKRPAEAPWPWWPMVLRPSSSHEEGGQRGWSVVADRFLGEGRVQAMRCVPVDWPEGPDGRRTMVMREPDAWELPVDLVLIAVGFQGVERTPLLDQLGVEVTDRGRIAADRGRTGLADVYACGDATRGASLVVWAIWEGRELARVIDQALTGRTALPTVPNRVPL